MAATWCSSSTHHRATTWLNTTHGPTTAAPEVRAANPRPSRQSFRDRDSDGVVLAYGCHLVLQLLQADGANAAKALAVADEAVGTVGADAQQLRGVAELQQQQTQRSMAKGIVRTAQHDT